MRESSRHFRRLSVSKSSCSSSSSSSSSVVVDCREGKMKGGTVQINWHDTKPVLSLDFHPNSSLLASSGADFDIKLWRIVCDEEKNVPAASYQSSLSYHSSAVNVVRFSPSGEFLASGADGGELILWKSHVVEAGETWKVLKTLSFHRKDVLDMEWSKDSQFLLSGSVDNSCIIWDISKGSVSQILDGHFHYVQGVAWDPLSKFVASISSDRTCRIYVNKQLSKGKGTEKPNYVCQHVICKTDPRGDDDGAAKSNLFLDETLPSFFRRLAWAPDGSFLLAPAGSYRLSSDHEPVNTAYVFSRRDLSRPAIHLPGGSKAVVACRFCPVVFCLRGSNPDSFFKLPYRLIFALATLNSLYIYDTESVAPIAIMAGIHYAAISDIAWSPDARFLALSSQDGYCTLLEFENDELGSPISCSEEKIRSDDDQTVVDDGIQADMSFFAAPDSTPKPQSGSTQEVDAALHSTPKPQSGSTQEDDAALHSTPKPRPGSTQEGNAAPGSTPEPQPGSTQEGNTTPLTATPSLPKGQSKRRITPTAMP